MEADMNNDELGLDDAQLQALVDGELDRSERARMFERLGSEPELQRRYGEMMQLQTAMQEDARSLVVPPESTLAIFSAVGIVAPQATGDAAVARHAGMEEGARAASRRILGKAGAFIGIAGAGAALFLLLRFADESATNPESRRLAARSEEVMIPHRGTFAREAAEDEIARAPGMRGAFSGRIDSSGKRPDDEIGLIPEKQKAVSDDEIPSSQHDPARGLSERRSESTDKPPAPPEQSVWNATLSAGSEAGGLPEGFALTLRLNAAASAPSTSVPSKSGTIWRNFAVGVAYAVAENDRLGLEAGRETFSQTFAAREHDIEFRYRQNPLEYWYSVYYERSFGSVITDLLHLYSRINAGGIVEIGPMLRASIGLKTAITRNLELHTAAEAAIAAYKLNDLWLTTKKYGGTAGFSITF